MKCLYCRSDQSSVVDKRAVGGSGEIRRRRECLKCHKRFTTYERIRAEQFTVIKRDGHREPFDVEKLKSGLVRALEKRPASQIVEEIVSRIEKRLRSKNKSEVLSRTIGQAVLSELKKIDKVAYLRFASVYRSFDDPGDFTKELENLTRI